MKGLYVGIIIVAALTVRLWIYRRRRSRRGSASGALGGSPLGTLLTRRRTRAPGRRPALEDSLGDVGKIAMREITERLHGRIFRVGTLIIVVVVGAVIVIPTIKSGGGPSTQTVGIVGPLSPGAQQAVNAAGSKTQVSVKLVPSPSLAAAKSDLASGKIDLAIVDANQILLDKPADAKGSTADSSFVETAATYLGLLKAYQAAGLTPAQTTQVAGAKPVPVESIHPAAQSTVQTSSIIGLVLLFFMLTQYNTWILIGVMQEKSSRVVEVLLATVRPIQLLGGKVLGIGLVALGQAALIVAFALVVAKAAGSNLLQGTNPLVLVYELLWLVLGYAFYSWVYAAAGSMAERQDQVQTLALPLSLPILVGYIYSITVASSGNPGLLFKVLAYVPFTAPFCMSELLALNQATWWQFALSVLITVGATVVTAFFAAGIYRRAVLRTGARVRLRDLFAGGVG